MANQKSSAANRKVPLKELQGLQQQADQLQGNLEALWVRIQKLQRDISREFFERFREQGRELSREEIASIRRELAEIREKLRTIEGLQSRYNVFKDLIELKKALIETSGNDEVKKILTEQKIMEILLKNRVIIETIFWHILKTFEWMLLRAKLPR